MKLRTSSGHKLCKQGNQHKLKEDRERFVPELYPEESTGTVLYSKWDPG